MYTATMILLLLLLTIFGTLLYYKTKNQRQHMLEDGNCPDCGASKKSFRDQNTGVTFESSTIKQRVVKNHGCSGIVEVEYTCKNCELKEVYNRVGSGCGI
ncbi:MAG: hypothetical protein HY307_03470 [Arcobacter sp.]|nr:hypothetical protein [Arcobacter sp.]